MLCLVFKVFQEFAFMVLLVESQGGKANAPVSLELTDVQRCKYLAILIDSQKHVITGLRYRAATKAIEHN